MLGVAEIPIKCYFGVVKVDLGLNFFFFFFRQKVQLYLYGVTMTSMIQRDRRYKVFFLFLLTNLRNLDTQPKFFFSEKNTVRL